MTPTVVLIVNVVILAVLVVVLGVALWKKEEQPLHWSVFVVGAFALVTSFATIYTENNPLAFRAAMDLIYEAAVLMLVVLYFYSLKATWNRRKPYASVLLVVFGIFYIFFRTWSNWSRYDDDFTALRLCF